MDFSNEAKISDAAWSFLRSNTTATLKFGEHTHDLSYVISPTGALVIPAMIAMLQPCDTVMFIPDYSEDCMEMHVSLCQFSPTGEQGVLADRWNVYHGESPDVQWALVDIDAARYHEMFIDGETLCRENPLVDIEPSVCKELNTQHQDAVRATCFAKTNVDVKEPFVVGVDPLGVDIRAPFGIVHIPTSVPFASPEDVFALFA